MPVVVDAGTLNPKFEYRNSKQIPMTQIRMTKTAAPRSDPVRFDKFSGIGAAYLFWSFEHSDFEFVSKFGFRASGLSMLLPLSKMRDDAQRRRIPVP